MDASPASSSSLLMDRFIQPALHDSHFHEALVRDSGGNVFCLECAIHCLQPDHDEILHLRKVRLLSGIDASFDLLGFHEKRSAALRLLPTFLEYMLKPMPAAVDEKEELSSLLLNVGMKFMEALGEGGGSAADDEMIDYHNHQQQHPNYAAEAQESIHVSIGPLMDAIRQHGVTSTMHLIQFLPMLPINLSLALQHEIMNPQYHSSTTSIDAFIKLLVAECASNYSIGDDGHADILYLLLKLVDDPDMRQMLTPTIIQGLQDGFFKDVIKAHLQQNNPLATARLSKNLLGLALALLPEASCSSSSSCSMSSSPSEAAADGRVDDDSQGLKAQLMMAWLQSFSLVLIRQWLVGQDPEIILASATFSLQLLRGEPASAGYLIDSGFIETLMESLRVSLRLLSGGFMVTLPHATVLRELSQLQPLAFFNISNFPLVMFQQMVSMLQQVALAYWDGQSYDDVCLELLDVLESSLTHSVILYSEDTLDVLLGLLTEERVSQRGASPFSTRLILFIGRYISEATNNKMLFPTQPKLASIVHVLSLTAPHLLHNHRGRPFHDQQQQQQEEMGDDDMVLEMPSPLLAFAFTALNVVDVVLCRVQSIQGFLSMLSSLLDLASIHLLHVLACSLSASSSTTGEESTCYLLFKHLLTAPGIHPQQYMTFMEELINVGVMEHALLRLKDPVLSSSSHQISRGGGGGGLHTAAFCGMITCLLDKMLGGRSSNQAFDRHLISLAHEIEGDTRHDVHRWLCKIIIKEVGGSGSEEGGASFSWQQQQNDSMIDPSSSFSSSAASSVRLETLLGILICLWKRLEQSFPEVSYESTNQFFAAIGRRGEQQQQQQLTPLSIFFLLCLVHQASASEHAAALSQSHVEQGIASALGSLTASRSLQKLIPLLTTPALTTLLLLGSYSNAQACIRLWLEHASSSSAAHTTSDGSPTSPFSSSLALPHEVRQALLSAIQGAYVRGGQSSHILRAASQLIRTVSRHQPTGGGRASSPILALGLHHGLEFILVASSVMNADLWQQTDIVAEVISLFIDVVLPAALQGLLSATKDTSTTDQTILQAGEHAVILVTRIASESLMAPWSPSRAMAQEFPPTRLSLTCLLLATTTESNPPRPRVTAAVLHLVNNLLLYHKDLPVKDKPASVLADSTHASMIQDLVWSLRDHPTILSFGLLYCLYQSDQGSPASSPPSAPSHPLLEIDFLSSCLSLQPATAAGSLMDIGDTDRGREGDWGQVREAALVETRRLALALLYRLIDAEGKPSSLPPSAAAGIDDEASFSMRMRQIRLILQGIVVLENDAFSRELALAFLLKLQQSTFFPSIATKKKATSAAAGDGWNRFLLRVLLEDGALWPCNTQAFVPLFVASQLHQAIVTAEEGEGGKQLMDEDLKHLLLQTDTIGKAIRWLQLTIEGFASGSTPFLPAALPSILYFLALCTEASFLTAKQEEVLHDVLKAHMTLDDRMINLHNTLLIPSLLHPPPSHRLQSLLDTSTIPPLSWPRHVHTLIHHPPPSPSSQAARQGGEEEKKRMKQPIWPTDIRIKEVLGQLLAHHPDGMID